MRCKTATTVHDLVHGTIAHEAGWLSPKSILAQGLKTKLTGEVEIVPFRWSGRNSHSARAEAAVKLGELIVQLTQEHQGANIYILAHSHGGNVALYAVRDNLKAAAAVRGIVNMATPYVVPNERNLERYVRTVVVWLVPPALFAVGIILQMALFSDRLLADLSDGWLLFGAGAFATFGFFPLRRFSKKVLVPRFKSRQKDLLAELTHRLPTNVSILNMRIDGDEASFWLRIISTLANFPYWFWNPRSMVFFILGPALLGPLLFAFGLFLWGWRDTSFFEQQPQSAAASLKFAALFFTFSFVILLLLTLMFTVLWQPFCVLWSSLFSASAVGFGSRGVYLNWLVKVTADSKLAGENVTERVYHRTFKLLQLRHALLYADASAITDIAAWIEHDRALPFQLSLDL